MDWTIDNMPSLRGMTAIVTGANSGIGWEAAKALAARHARVILAVRSVERGAAAKNRILAEVPQADVAVMRIDLADLSSVQAFADEVMERERKVNLLVNNAGVMAPSYQRTQQGLELQFGTNHIGHFALTLRLLPTLCKGRGARVVTVSSMAHTMAKALDIPYLRGDGRYRRFSSYSQSKLANLLFAYELQRRVQSRGLALQSIAAHPGFAATSLLDNGMFAKSTWVRPFARWVNRFAQPSEMGALPTLYAATHPDLIGGEYIGPVGGMRGYPGIVRSSDASYDVDAAKRLWELSLELANIRPDDWIALADTV
ncbi:short-chain dehydrogenase [Alicyclobacillus tengchongensis]|nr:short-chain dehydrogenase [Alicyclobacillus tengchongensis]